MRDGEAVWLVYEFRHGNVIAAFTFRLDLVRWLQSLPWDYASQLYVDRYDVGVVDGEVYPIDYVGWELLQ